MPTMDAPPIGCSRNRMHLEVHALRTGCFKAGIDGCTSKRMLYELDGSKAGGAGCTSKRMLCKPDDLELAATDAPPSVYSANCMN